jgi:plastocyanin
VKFQTIGVLGLTVIVVILITPSIISSVTAQLVPDWIRNTAKWYGEGSISETEFLNAIKYLIENKIIKLDLVAEEKPKKAESAMIIIPNGNAKVGNAGSYIPLSLEIQKGTTVIWLNDDNVGHTVQSQDGHGNVIPKFNSNILKTGERFAYKFDESGTHHYFCTLHPWRVGVVLVK